MTPTERKNLLRTLRGKNGVAVASAVATLPMQDEELVGAAIDAFDRLCVDAPKRDPQCHGKVAIARTLREAEVPAPSVFVAGVTHVQMEPVWGGRVDTAAELRGICGLALVESHHPRAMTYVGEMLADAEPAARVAAARALRVSGDAAVAEPLLRLRLRSGEDHPDVLHEAFGALLELAPAPALEFIAPLLRHADPAYADAAALALGASRRAEAFEILRDAAEDAVASERRRPLLLALALLRHDNAWTYLLELVMDAAAPTAKHALAALGTFSHDAELRERCLAAVEARGDAEVTAAFEAEFSA